MKTFKELRENFKDGRNPQDKGDMARHGLKGKTIAQLKKVRSSKTASPRKKQLAHWFINMHSEAMERKGSEHTEIMTPKQMKDHIGTARFNAVTKHPWYKEHYANKNVVGMKYTRTPTGLETVHVAHGPEGEGSKSLRRMTQFHLNYSGRKITQAHHYHNWGSERHPSDGNLRWKHIKSLHETEDD